MSRRHLTLISRLPIIAVGVFLLLGALILLPGQSAPQAKADTTLSVTGYAWSSNIGWIKFDHGLGNAVVFNSSDNSFSGYAWSNHVGWIKFGPFDPTETYPAAPAHGARYDSDSGFLTGWIRACVAAPNPATCSGTGANTYSGGWDGWIKLSNNVNPGTTWGVKAIPVVGGYGTQGFAWGGDVMGWVNFSPRVTMPTSCESTGTCACDPSKQVCWDGDDDLSANLTINGVTASDSILDTTWEDIINGNGILGVSFPNPNVTVSVKVGDTISWSSSGPDGLKCTLVDQAINPVEGASGTVGSINISTSLLSNTVYYLGCTTDDANFVVAAINVSSGNTLTINIVDPTGNGTVSSNPSGYNCPQDGSFTCDYGADDDDITLIAHEGNSPDGAFSGWSGDIGNCVPTATSCTLTMNQSRTVTATFGNGGDSFEFDIGGKALGEGITYVIDPADGVICSVPIPISLKNVGNKVTDVTINLASGLPTVPGFTAPVAHFTTTNSATDCSNSNQTISLSPSDQVYLRIYFTDRGTTNTNVPSPYSSRSDYPLVLHGVANTGKTADSTSGPWLRYKDSRSAETGVSGSNQ